MRSSGLTTVGQPRAWHVWRSSPGTTRLQSLQRAPGGGFGSSQHLQRSSAMGLPPLRERNRLIEQLASCFAGLNRAVAIEEGQIHERLPLPVLRNLNDGTSLTEDL